MYKKILIMIIILLILISTGIFVKIKFLSSSTQEETDISPTPSIVLPTVSENIIVDLMAASGKQAVILKIKGLTSDIESIEYELTYMTGAGLPRGVLGKINLSGEKEIVRDDIVLGTCSSGKCVYDGGVTEVNLSLKFNTSSGSSIFQKTYSL